eukprot:13523151-Alexandrium_andersonii.AAC.1
MDSLPGDPIQRECPGWNRNANLDQRVLSAWFDARVSFQWQLQLPACGWLAGGAAKLGGADNG